MAAAEDQTCKLYLLYLAVTLQATVSACFNKNPNQSKKRIRISSLAQNFHNIVLSHLKYYM
jgi:hypothetical protein